VTTTHVIHLLVNGQEVTEEVPARLLLSDFLRLRLGLTGTHVGCEHGVCGACTVLVDEEAVRSCLMLAVQADGHRVETVEALGTRGSLHPLQAAFQAERALQCGFCTPGILMSMKAWLADHPEPSEEEVREALSGTLCRCTGYEPIVAAVMRVVRSRQAASFGGAR
jgi:aerobic-type carbon monoxide dehydrogenase small subunit (CoxS/CutS family)